MSYRHSYQEIRRRCIESYDAEEAKKYDAWISSLTSEDHAACLADIQTFIPLKPGMQILDAGAGSGALCMALQQFDGLALTALEPCPPMIELFQRRPQLSDIRIVEGFCDHPCDEALFEAEFFDVVASRQLANTLFDPLAAFRNWSRWLRPGGRLVIMDGLFDRDAWTGKWSWAVDQLPLSACRSRATVPYLLEQVGFNVDYSGPATETNKLPSTRTERYLVIATKPH